MLESEAAAVSLIAGMIYSFSRSTARCTVLKFLRASSCGSRRSGWSCVSTSIRSRFVMEVRSNGYQDDVALRVELGGCQLCCHVDGAYVCFDLGCESEG